ncbi:HDOD domain-containing protein [Paraglaciecola aestuariivivens]
MNVKDYADNAGDIFVLPEAVIKIKQLIDDNTTSMEDVAEVINYDPAVMSQVLKVSNSALYKFPNTITTVSKAIQVIGTRSIYDLVLAYGVASAFQDLPTDVIDLDKFWEQSVSCALLSKHLAEEVGIRESEQLFVCGLLHNIGELTLVKLNPEVAKLCAQLTSDATPLMLQKQHLGFTYTDISAALLTKWGIPADITQLISNTHASEHTAKGQAQKVLQLAYILARNNINQELYERDFELTESMYSDLDLDIEAIDNALDFSNLQLMSALALFSPSSFAMY